MTRIHKSHCKSTSINAPTRTARASINAIPKRARYSAPQSLSYTLNRTPAFAMHCQPLVLTNECRLLALRLDNTCPSHHTLTLTAPLPAAALFARCDDAANRSFMPCDTGPAVQQRRAHLQCAHTKSRQPTHAGVSNLATRDTSGACCSCVLLYTVCNAYLSSILQRYNTLDKHKRRDGWTKSIQHISSSSSSSSGSRDSGGSSRGDTVGKHSQREGRDK